MSAILDVAALKAHPLPPLLEDGDKEDRGAVLVAGGGTDLAGASILAGVAALRVGAGKLQLRSDKDGLAALAVAVPEARIIVAGTGERGTERLSVAAGQASSLVIGPGADTRPRERRRARRLLQAAPSASAVIDAGALPDLSTAKAFAAVAGGRTVLTPHAGEMAAMLGQTKDVVSQDPLIAARQAATLFQSVVVMKGSTTFVVMPDGATWRHGGGVCGLGTSGSGDVLAGAIGGLLARGAAPIVAALWGVVMHAEAGADLTRRHGRLGFLARELPDVLPRVMARLEASAVDA
ncbi:MAG: NAD(P)H-hydrate dehydratase [Brevundimonas sp.]|nr:MAG: NAD(P)H-hydrate dehydratase [Brevundimonas sp.]